MTVKEEIGSFKAHERLRGPSESGGSKLLLTEEEWTRKERDGNLLLTIEEWFERAKKENFENLDVMTVKGEIGSFKAHEERLRGPSESGGSKLLLTEEEWTRQERDGNILLTMEECLERANKENFENLDVMTVKEEIGSFKAHERLRGPSESGGSKLLLTEEEWTRQERDGNILLTIEEWREKDTKEEANMMQIPDNEPALLLLKEEKDNKAAMLVNEEKVMPKLNKNRG
ncbi:hypothetical protein AgCh_034112 [Apium graveolens]